MIKIHRINTSSGVVTSEVDPYEVKRAFTKDIRDRCCTMTGYIVTKLFGFAPTSSNPRFTAKSRCLDGDEFNASIGIDIADAKTDIKFHHHMARKYHWIIKTLTRAVKELTELEEYHLKKEGNIRKYLDRY